LIVISTSELGGNIDVDPHSNEVRKSALYDNVFQRG